MIFDIKIIITKPRVLEASKNEYFQEKYHLDLETEIFKLLVHMKNNQK